MARYTLFRSTLLILCLGAATLPAQQAEMIPPPLPSGLPPEPPDPATLPPLPQFEWQPLAPQGSEIEGGGVVATAVPPPQTEVPVAPPPPPAEEVPLPDGPDPAEMELAKPEIEVWRPEGQTPQVPGRRANRLDPVFVTGTEPAALLVKFDPGTAGKKVWVSLGRGLALNPSTPIMTISSSGEFLVEAQLAEGLARSHVIVYCEGIKTILPVIRAPLPTVEAAEAGGGE